VRLLLAHGLGGRSDLPVPLWLALYGGGAAVIVSFTALGAFWQETRLERGGRDLVLPPVVQRALDARATRGVARALTVAMFVVTLLVAALGTDSSASNPAPTWFYVWFWVGLVPASLLLGSVWRVANPLRALSAGLARLSGPAHSSAARSVPAAVGYWPAAAGLTAFVWLELVYARADVPLTVFVFVALYALVQVVAAQSFGPDWYARGDGFEVYSSLIARLSPWARDEHHRLVWRNPLRNLAQLRSEPGLLAVVCVLLGSTAFDGLSRTELWQGLTRATGGLALLMMGTAGMAACIAFVGFTYVAATAASERFVALRASARPSLPGCFVHSLVPIVVGYTVAHYFSFFVFQGQAGYILASNPFGSGRDLFGTLGWSIDYTAVSTRTIALVQVAAIVGAHVIAVVAAHDRAMRMFPVPARTRGQYALLAVMVTYTVGGIALLVGT
jgi:hypothetical protein